VMETKKGYWVVAYRSVSDAAALAEYGKIAGPVIQSKGGKFLVRTNEGIHAVEAGLQMRTVVVQYESFAAAKAAYESEEYKVALKALGSAAERDFRIIEGVD
jgi:uncharacterized protein (DUF1330 family)